MGNKKIMKILNYFLDNPSSEASQTEIRNKINLSKATAVKWMDFLVKNQFIDKKVIGVTNLYKLNQNNIINKELKRLLNLIKIRKIETIRKNFDCEVYLYGSSARGEDTKDSDIDILIIGDVKRQQIIKDIDRLSKEIKRKISFKIFSQMDWSQLARKDKPFFERVEKDKIRLA